MRPDLAEYLRRNQLHCAAVGARANAESAAKRLRTTKRPPKWLLELLDGIIERAARVEDEMVKHRNEVGNAHYFATRTRHREGSK